MEVYHGRPQDDSQRTEAELKTYDFLDKLGIKYDRVDHEHAETMEACADIEKALETEVCKNLFLCNRQKTVYYLLLMPGSKPFKTKELSSQINAARLSFASGEDMEKILGVTPGSVTVLGLINDSARSVQLLIDKDLTKQEYIGCHPCMNTSTLKIKTDDILKKILPALKHRPTYVRLTGKD
ncbi:hypothetical protein HMPREF9333_01278 [Johnsonella ignava ATCC 51276]|jgi:hypothetical protein|uniref:YbaK/aminoacyl-tRNA synthetase-associated domain-containing protein n=1 Tax=Johnsonella ignava ATCC 51276 TaxID=679200 RepID=G5GI88_9FIRM|nr:prolyl-tRNA synthetase associated domain-containing protein [Johnsonella ignava]EHI55563.1 hypothetical protein HMPREF9333_01278 [Johnsonella ignava ATCC 51276]